MKSAKNDFPIVIPIQQEIIERAEAMGRKLEIFSGLPTQVPENQLWGRSPVLVQRRTKINLRMYLGLGPGTSGVYFGIEEAF